MPPALLLPQYNLSETLLGGQSFAWDRTDEGYAGFTSSRAVILTPAATGVKWESAPHEDDGKFLREYLRVDEEYGEIVKAIGKDRHVRRAMRHTPHIRLLKQPFEQTLFSFIVSINKNIPSIRAIIRAMNRRFGEKVSIGSRIIHLFPQTEALAEATLDDLWTCGLGFRAKYIKAAARHVIETRLADRIHSMTEEEARAALMEIYGVGEKVADCVLVFSLSFDNVTPLDVWGRRIFTELYGLSPRMKYADMRRWVSGRFGGYAGWAGQYLFESYRKGIYDRRT